MIVANGNNNAQLEHILDFLVFWFLVPKLRLGTVLAKLCFAEASSVSEADAKRSFADGVPKRSLGTRKDEEGKPYRKE